MKYLDCLKVRSIEESIDEEITAFELANNIKLPPLYKAFIQTYRTDKDALKLLSYNRGNNNSMVGFYERKFLLDEDNISLYDIFQLNEIMENMNKVYPKDDEIWKENLVAIGECAFQMYLMVGIGENNKDKIYIEAVTESQRITYLCDNIFIFFRNYIFVIADYLLPNGKTTSDLYNNWGEDFWRIREDEK